MMPSLRALFARRPRVALLLLTIVLAGGTGAGLYLFGLHEWHAALKSLEKEQAVEAQQHLKWCLQMWPWSTPVHLKAARAARLKGDFQEAESHLKQCLKLQKGSTAETELEFLLLRVQEGEVDAVAPVLWQCVEQHHSESPLILETLAQAYIHDLRFGPALSCLNHCLEIAPDRALARYWHGWIYEYLGDRNEALQDYQQAIQLDPDYIPARRRLADLCLQLVRVEEALPHLEYLQQHFPDRADVQANLGHCRYLQGDLAEARRLLESAVEQLPNDLTVLILLGRLENQEGHFRQAEHWLRRALAVDATDPEAYHLLVRSLQGQNRPEDAEVEEEHRIQALTRVKRIHQLLREAAQQPLSNPDSMCEIGQLFLDGKEDRLALYWLHQALEVDSSHVPTHRALAQYYEKKGDTERAKAHRRWLEEADRKAPSPTRRKPSTVSR